MSSHKGWALAGGVCLVIAVGLATARELELMAFGSTLVDVELPLTPGRVGPTEFSVDQEGRYELVVKISRPTDVSTRRSAECLLGFDRGNEHWGLSAAQPHCELSPVVDLRWRLESFDPSDDSPQEGEATGLAEAGGFSADEADRWIEAFDLRRGTRYTLSIETHADAISLAPFRPRIVLQSGPAMNRDEAMTTFLIWVVAALFGFVGIGALGTAVVLQRVKGDRAANDESSTRFVT